VTVLAAPPEAIAIPLTVVVCSILISPAYFVAALVGTVPSNVY
jgi:hypothetical protein